MSNPSIAHIIISSAAIGGIMVFWLELTAEAVRKVVRFPTKCLLIRVQKKEKDKEVSERLGEILRRREEEEAAGKED